MATGTLSKLMRLEIPAARRRDARGSQPRCHGQLQFHDRAAALRDVREPARAVVLNELRPLVGMLCDQHIMGGL